MKMFGVPPLFMCACGGGLFGQSRPSRMRRDYLIRYPGGRNGKLRLRNVPNQVDCEICEERRLVIHCCMVYESVQCLRFQKKALKL